MPHFTAADGAQLYYDDTGHGLALLCLAGLTRTGRDFDYLAPHLPPLRMIRMDYRGRGRSDWTGAETYTIAQEAADTLALLDHLGLDEAAVLGTSRGGLIGMFLATTAHERLRGLCLNDIGPEIAPEGLAHIRASLGRNPDARSHAAAAVALEHGARGFANLPAGRWLDEARRRYPQTEQGLTISYDPALKQAFEVARAHEPTPDLWPMFDACAGLPLALIRGANSALLSPETAEEMCRRRPDMVFGEVPDRGHVPFLDEAESLRVIHQFLGLCL